MVDLRLIAAVGHRGQLGLGGHIPWHDPADLAFFKASTLWCTVIMGARTAHAVGYLPNRRIVVWDGRQPPEEFLAQLEASAAPKWTTGTPVWVAGGARTYAAFMPLVRTCVITRVDYDGPADAWMPPLWESAP